MFKKGFILFFLFLLKTNTSFAANNMDANRDGCISLTDAIMVSSYLTKNGGGNLPTGGSTLDINNDKKITGIDMLLVIGCLNGRGQTCSHALCPGSQNPVPAPSAPKNLSAAAVSQTELKLSWSDSQFETSYLIYSAKGQNKYSLLSTVPANTTSYNIKNITPNTLYSFYVTAKNSRGSASSQVATARIDVLISCTNTKAYKPYPFAGVMDLKIPGFAESEYFFSRAVVDNKNRIVAIGERITAQSSGGLFLARFNANGELDQTFGKNGIFSGEVLNNGNYRNPSNGILTVAPDGKILLAGTSFSLVQGAGYAAPFVGRLDENGAIDTSFYQAGVARIDANGLPSSIVTDSNGGVYIFVNANLVQGGSRSVIAYFGPTLTQHIGLFNAIGDFKNISYNEIVLDSKCNLLASGMAYSFVGNSINRGIIVAKFTWKQDPKNAKNFFLEPATSFGNLPDFPGIQLLAEKNYIGGISIAATANRIFVSSFNLSGQSLVLGLNEKGGVESETTLPGQQYGSYLTLDSNERLMAFGRKFSGNSSGNIVFEVSATRLLITGKIDSSFGTNGSMSLATINGLPKGFGIVGAGIALDNSPALITGNALHHPITGLQF